MVGSDDVVGCGVVVRDGGCGATVVGAPTVACGTTDDATMGAGKRPVRPCSARGFIACKGMACGGAPTAF